DGIRDRNVTGVQTCALPIFEVSFSGVFECYVFAASRCWKRNRSVQNRDLQWIFALKMELRARLRQAHCRHHPRAFSFFQEKVEQIGRASCRQREEMAGFARA